MPPSFHGQGPAKSTSEPFANSRWLNLAAKMNRTGCLARAGAAKLNIREALRQYVSEELLEEEAPVEDDENLLADGMVDSLGMLRLVAFIEESYGVRVPPQDFTIENFRTIETLDTYLSRKVNDPDAVANHD